MSAAVLESFGAPRHFQFQAPSSDVAAGELLVRPLAVAVNGIDKAIASGKHFLSPKALPVVAGVDGVGLTTDDRLVYFDGTVAPWGAMAELTVAREQNIIALPRDADPAIAAALGNAGLAAWLPLSWRAAMRKGETVAVLGGAGVVGSLAVQVARVQGAGKVIAVVRGAAGVAHALRLGADAVIDTAAAQWSSKLKQVSGAGVDVFVDYVWGEVTASALGAAAINARVVQVGTVAGDVLQLSGEALRARSIDILGYVSFRAPLDLRTEAYQAMVRLAQQGKLEVGVHRYPLADISAAWNHVSTGAPTRPVVII